MILYKTKTHQKCRRIAKLALWMHVGFVQVQWSHDYLYSFVVWKNMNQ